MHKWSKNNPWYFLSLYISKGKELTDPSDTEQKQLSTGPDRVHICTLLQEAAQNIYFFEVGVLVCHRQCFCVKPDLSCSRLFVEWRLENRHFVIVLSHRTSSPPMCWCLPYALTSFPLGQMADTGFRRCFPNALFVLDCNLFNFPVVMPSNEFCSNKNTWIVHTLSLDFFLPT